MQLSTTKFALLLTLISIGIVFIIVSFGREVNGKCGDDLGEFKIIETFSVDTKTCRVETWSSPPYVVSVLGMNGTLCELKIERHFLPEAQVEICKVPIGSDVIKFDRRMATYRGTFCSVVDLQYTIDESACNIVSE